MDKLTDLKKKRDELKQRIAWLEKELNEEKDNEDTWGGHDGPGYMDLENELIVRVELLKDIEEKIHKLTKGYINTK